MGEFPVAGHGLVGGELPVAVGALFGPVVAVHPHVLLQVAGRKGLAAKLTHGGLHVGRSGVVQIVDLQGAAVVQWCRGIAEFRNYIRVLARLHVLAKNLPGITLSKTDFILSMRPKISSSPQ